MGRPGSALVRPDICGLDDDLLLLGGRARRNELRLPLRRFGRLATGSVLCGFSSAMGFGIHRRAEIFASALPVAPNRLGILDQAVRLKVRTRYGGKSNACSKPVEEAAHAQDDRAERVRHGAASPAKKIACRRQSAMNAGASQIGSMSSQRELKSSGSPRPHLGMAYAESTAYPPLRGGLIPCPFSTTWRRGYKTALPRKKPSPRSGEGSPRSGRVRPPRERRRR